VFIFCIVYNIVTSIFYIFDDHDVKSYEEVITPVFIAFRFLKVGLDFTMEGLFLILLKFFIDYRQKAKNYLSSITL
jgi:hypothetical protein